MPACPHPDDRLERLFPARDYITGDPFVVARCGDCGLTITHPAPGAARMPRYYPDGYYGATGGSRFPGAMEALQGALYRGRASELERLVGRPGRVLDVGCGRGLLLRAFQRRGWEVLGTELGEAAAAYPRDVLGLPVRVGRLDELRFPDGHFDAVTLWHVLEHTSDPAATLSEVARILKPGGWCMVGVPNFDSPESRLCRDRWFHLDVPRHLTHFTPVTLRSAMAAAGLPVSRVSGFALEYDHFSFVQSGLNRLGLRPNRLYDLLRGRGAKVLKDVPTGGPEIALTLLLAVPLGLLSVPFTALAGLLGQGATMTMRGRKASSP
jgi:SAM-dependent methyltransferase